MTRLALFSIVVSVWLLPGIMGNAEAKTDSVERKTLQKRSTVRYSTSPSHLEHPKSKGSGKEMSFEVLRMLSTGMTKAEVMSRAGLPQHTFRQGRSSTWVYSATDHWIVELAFGGGRVSVINWSRP
ncbi:MAG TPA: hypothetical protein VGJ57_04595 [Nitrospirales bacterium]|jgi:hypothetical protein